MHTKDMTW